MKSVEPVRLTLRQYFCCIDVNLTSDILRQTSFMPMDIMMKDADFKITTENLVKCAASNLAYKTNQAYRVYTDEVLKIYPSLKSDPERCNGQMKTIKARLSQGLGVANKSSKAVIIQFYAEKFSEDPALNMSAREADDIFKKTIGRSMAKGMWKGLFKREDNDISPYFTNPEYKKDIFNHPLIKSLKSHMDELELLLSEWRKTRENPYRNEIIQAREKYNSPV